MSQYALTLDSEEKALVTNALIYLKLQMMAEKDFGDSMDELNALIERIQIMRPKTNGRYAEAR